jgi:ribose 5-phosphate isomerase A
MGISIQDSAKKRAALDAFEAIRSNTLLGIGTGSTVYFLIEKLLREEKNLSLKLAFSSTQSKELLKTSHFDQLTDELDQEIDLTIDGADYVSPGGILIKGGGGALTREKLLIHASKKSIIIIDESKFITKQTPVILPIEILQFGHTSTIKRLNFLGLSGSIRKKKDNSLFITDNHNLIYDAKISFPLSNAKELHQNIKLITGVVETGLFFDFPMEVRIAFFDEKKAIQTLRFSN